MKHGIVSTHSRRAFLGAAAATFAGGAWPQAGQQRVLAYWGAWYAAGRPPVAERLRWLEEELAAHGFVAGRNLRIVYAFTGWDTRHEIDDEARRIVAAGADVAWPRLDMSHDKRRALRAASATLPIVMDYWDELSALAEVGDLRHPAGNVTGVATNYTLLTTKRFELVRELLPQASRVALVFHGAGQARPFFESLDALEVAARNVGLAVVRVDLARHGCAAAVDTAQGGAALDAALEEVRAARVHALLSFGAWACAPLRDRQLEAFEARHRIPYVHDGGSHGSAIGLGWDYTDHRGKALAVVVKLLKGARPADIPIEVTSRMLLTVNPSRARAIGLAIPPQLLVRADRIVEARDPS